MKSLRAETGSEELCILGVGDNRYQKKLIAETPIPMPIVRLFFLLLTAASLIFLVIGLFRPWAMLWWEDVQNRRKVIKVYGSAMLICYAIYWVLYFF